MPPIGKGPLGRVLEIPVSFSTRACHPQFLSHSSYFGLEWFLDPPPGIHEMLLHRQAHHSQIRCARLRERQPFQKGSPLMPLIVWTDQMSVEVKLLDNDHKKLVLLINQLHEGLMTGRAKLELEGVFEELVSYTRVHHAQEEHLLIESGYHGSAAHKQEHESTIDRVVALQMRFNSSEEL